MTLISDMTLPDDVVEKAWAAYLATNKMQAAIRALATHSGDGEGK